MIDFSSKEKFVVVKFHDEEKYAVSVCSGSRHECEKKAAYFRGLYHDLPYIKFGVFTAAHYDFCKEIEVTGGDEVYDTILRVNVTTSAKIVSIGR